MINYYSFGMPMPGRTFSSGSQYRYGFNGKEKSTEISEGDYDFGARIQDNRTGRFLSVDPLQTSYPYYSPYIFAANNPTASVDFDGRDIIRFVTTTMFFPGRSSGLDGNVGGVAPYCLTDSRVVVIKNPGADQFFTDAVKVQYEANGTRKKYPTKSTEFFPTDNSPLSLLFRSSGITQTSGTLIPFVDSNDPDFLSLVKLAPPELVSYLEKHDPKTYEGLASSQAGLRLQDRIDIVGNMMLILIDGVNVFNELAVETIPKWNGPVDYSILDQTDGFAHTRGTGKDFTASQKTKIKEYNKTMNGGLLRSDIDGGIVDESGANVKGKLKNMNQAEVDHKKAKKHPTNPGTNQYSNARVISAKDNLEKSNH